MESLWQQSCHSGCFCCSSSCSEVTCVLAVVFTDMMLIDCFMSRWLSFSPTPSDGLAVKGSMQLSFCNLYCLVPSQFSSETDSSSEWSYRSWTCCAFLFVLYLSLGSATAVEWRCRHTERMSRALTGHCLTSKALKSPSFYDKKTEF